MLAFTVTYDQKARPVADTKHEKTILCPRIFFIEELYCEFVIENGLSFLKRNAMLLLI